MDSKVDLIDFYAAVDKLEHGKYPGTFIRAFSLTRYFLPASLQHEALNSFFLEVKLQLKHY